LDSGGFTDLLRLRGRADSEINTSVISTPAYNLAGKKRKAQDDESPGSIKLFDDLDTHISGCRLVCEEMVGTASVGRTWKDQIEAYLDEIMISSRKIESVDAIGQIATRKEARREALLLNGDLYMDLGILKEKIRTFESENEYLKAQIKPS